MKTLDEILFPLILGIFTLAMFNLFLAFCGYVEKNGL